MKSYLLTGLILLSFQLSAQEGGKPETPPSELSAKEELDGPVNLAGCSFSDDEKWIECPHGKRYERKDAGVVQGVLRSNNFKFNKEGELEITRKSPRQLKRAKKQYDREMKRNAKRAINQ